MWTTIKESLLGLAKVEPEVVIHLAGGYARVRLSPMSAEHIAELALSETSRPQREALRRPL